MPPPPKSVRNAVLALGVSALAALIAALTLFGEKDWLLRTYVKNNPDPGKKNHQSLAKLQDAADKAPSTSLVVTIVLVVALGLAAWGVWRGRHWARWTVIGLWVLATFTSTFAGFTYLIAIASNEPLAFKIPSFISAAALIAAVALVSIRRSVAYFMLTRPPRPGAVAGAPRRGGLFGPRPARPGFAAPGSATRGATATKTARDGTAREGAERSRAKQRASTESVAKGAELARARAKASKSRRSGV